ncbi:hypothetical protein IIC65_02780 [Candidatus Sumerlaeota bacterium]|nr:hypothetical protein [Candidatus Sumerlaeota bacterium]
MNKPLRRIAIFFFAIGLALLALNISGFFIPLRNSKIYTELETGFTDDITLTAEQTMAQISRLEGERAEDYVRRLNGVINRGIAHYWEDEGIRRYRLHVPPYENFLLYVAGHLDRRLKKYEFYDYKKAIERGVGLCSQQSLIVGSILSENQVRARLAGLEGHVVTLAEVDEARGVWWVLDPDYGVIIDHSLDEIESDPELIRPYYSARGYGAEAVDNLVRIYGPDGNRVRESAARYHTLAWFERLTYVMIWLIPVVCLTPYPAALFLARRRKSALP